MPTDQSDGRPDALTLYRFSHTAICDVIEPWDHGTVARATAYPTYWDFNVVRVEDDPGMGVGELVEFADQALAGLSHRKIDFDLAANAEPLRPGFEERGWTSERLLYMLHVDEPPAGDAVAVREVPYEAADDLRAAWYREDYPGRDPLDFHEQAREVALRLGVRVLAILEDEIAVAFAQIEGNGVAAEITQVYVHPDQRGRGLGTALTRAAIKSDGTIENLWICADDEGRPKELYERLGFRPYLTTMQFTRLP